MGDGTGLGDGLGGGGGPGGGGTGKGLGLGLGLVELDDPDFLEFKRKKEEDRQRKIKEEAERKAKAKQEEEEAEKKRVEEEAAKKAREEAGEGPPLKDDPVYGKFFKMMKAGVPKPAVANKMAAEGLDPAILDMDPNLPAPKKPGEGPPLKDDPVYGKFFKMMKAGVPKPAVANKMVAEGLDPAILDMDPNKPAPAKEGGGPPLKDDPVYAPYFKMLKVGLAKPVVAQKMQKDGLDPAVLDMDPNKPVPKADAAVPGLPLKDDPTYAPYFKMLKVGMPKPAVAQKMQKDGLDPKVLDMDPEQPVPPEFGGNGSKDDKKKEDDPKKPKVRRKRLHWTGIDQARLTRGESIWTSNQATGATELEIDDEEFDQLFVLTELSDLAKQQANDKKQTDKPKDKKKETVHLIDSKRAMNGGIALARIKIAYTKIAHNIKGLRGHDFTLDQLMALAELLPTDEERRLLLAYKGDKDVLGEADKFMLQVQGITDASHRLRCLTFQKRFPVAQREICSLVGVVDAACDDVKKSDRLRSMFGMILKLGNKLNAGGDQVQAFTLDSLLKLKDAKAFDQKTTIMQYLVRLIQRHDPTILDVKDDLKHVLKASRTPSSMITTELEQLRSGLKDAHEIVQRDANDPSNESESSEESDSDSANESDTDSGSETGSASGSDGEAAHSRGRAAQRAVGHGRQVTFTTFVAHAQARMVSVTDLVSRMQGNYKKMLDYFKEDPGMAYDVFFKTLHAFVGAFEQARKEVDEAKRQEELKRKRALADEERKKMIKGKKTVEFGPGVAAGNTAGGGAGAMGGAGGAGGRPRARTTGSDERPDSAGGGGGEGAAPGARGRRHSMQMEADSGRGTFDQTAALMLSRVASIRSHIGGDSGSDSDGNNSFGSESDEGSESESESESGSGSESVGEDADHDARSTEPASPLPTPPPPPASSVASNGPAADAPAPTTPERRSPGAGAGTGQGSSPAASPDWKSPEKSPAPPPKPPVRARMGRRGSTQM